MPPSGHAALGSKVLMGAVPAEPMAYFGLTCRIATPHLPPPGAHANRPAFPRFHSATSSYWKGPAFDLRATHARTLRTMRVSIELVHSSSSSSAIHTMLWCYGDSTNRVIPSDRLRTLGAHRRGIRCCVHRLRLLIVRLSTPSLSMSLLLCCARVELVEFLVFLPYTITIAF